MSNIDNIQLWSDTALARKASVRALTASEQQAAEAQKEQKFNMAWNAPGGLNRVAFAMSAPLKTRLDYVGVGRKLLAVDTIPAGEIPFYDYDIAEFGAVKLASRGSTPVFESNVKRTVIPTFEVAVDEIVRKVEMSLRRYDVFNRAKERISIAMAIAEDDMIFNLVKSAVANGSGMGTYSNDITKAAFATMYGNMAEKQLVADKYLFGAKTFADILKWNSTDLDPVSLNIQIESGKFGSIFGVRAIASTRLDKVVGTESGVNKQPVFTLTTPDKLGRLPERKSVEVAIFDNVPERRYDIVACEIIGLGITNVGGVEGIKKQ